jgi:hypothetical protein
MTAILVGRRQRIHVPIHTHIQIRKTATHPHSLLPTNKHDQKQVLADPANTGASGTPCMFLNAFMDRSFDYGVLVRGPVALGSLEVNMT